ncbi:aminopeptidase P family protein [Candidatus Geothermarchaeota archaeon]|nr:MAG: aminopeptidase P family protein [Candidatus Geothermarchaeota archaeon]
MRLVISVNELNRRIQNLLESINKERLDALYIVSSANIAYLTNFFFIPTERPIAYVLTKNGDRILIVPRLEYEHAIKYAYVDKVLYYLEYPDEKHPMERIAQILKELKLGDKRIGFDIDGYGHIYGYRGPRLSNLLKEAKMIYARDLIEELRIVKSDEEIMLMRESAKWTIYVHRLLQDYIQPGLYEDEISMAASMEATLAIARAIGGLYRPGGWFAGAHAGFRGQIGLHSFYPHSLTQHFKLKKGDILVTGAGANISGYSVELERTLILGEPSDKVKKYFKLMVEAQKTAMDMIKPGIKCSDVDRMVRKFFKDNGIMEFWRHHTGHGLGLEMHEAPFLDIGYNRVLKEGMIVSVEPGIYVPGLGGFRHSDTILVTGDGYETLTEYPRELEDLIIYT